MFQSPCLNHECIRTIVANARRIWNPATLVVGSSQKRSMISPMSVRRNGSPPVTFAKRTGGSLSISAGVNSSCAMIGCIQRWHIAQHPLQRYVTITAHPYNRRFSMLCAETRPALIPRCTLGLRSPRCADTQLHMR